jgi:putative membrane protein
MSEQKKENNQAKIGNILIRILMTMLVLAIAAFLTPRFSISGIVPLLIAAVVISVLDYLIESLTGFDATPFGRGITGFIISAIIIYATGYLVSGVRISILGSILAALAIGVINMLIPGRSVL